jgi:hypothetical protein
MMRGDARKRLTVADLGRAAGHRHDSFPLIGMIGKKRSGKDSVAAVLVDEYDFTRYAFADPLKEAALALDPFVGNAAGWDYRLSAVVEREGWEAAKERPEVRRTLQNYGVAIREIDPDFWLRTTMRRVIEHRGPVVVTDCRFPNEAEAIRSAGGKVVRVIRPGLVSTDTHVSETALDDFVADAEIINSGTLDDLAGVVRALF